MSTQDAINRLVKHLAIYFVIGASFGLSTLKIEYLWNNREIQRQVLADQAAQRQEAERRAEFAARPFSDFVVYYRIFAAFGAKHKEAYKALRDRGIDETTALNKVLREMTVKPGSVARLVSDRAILEVPEGGFRGEWEEFMQCDEYPYDGIRKWDYYAEVNTTGRRYTEVIERASPDKLVASKGFPLNYKQRMWPEDIGGVPSSERGKIPIRYPSNDADCRLIADMTITFQDGSKKQTRLIGDVIRVRGE